MAAGMSLRSPALLVGLLVTVVLVVALGAPAHAEPFRPFSADIKLGVQVGEVTRLDSRLHVGAVVGLRELGERWALTGSLGAFGSLGKVSGEDDGDMISEPPRSERARPSDETVTSTR